MFIKLNYRKGVCAVWSLALAFHTSYQQMQCLFDVLCDTPRSGCTYKEVKECIRYAEALYPYKSTTRIAWSGMLFDFIKEYPEGTYLTNCDGHVGIVFNGVILGSKFKNYKVYNVWQVKNVLLDGVEASPLTVTSSVRSVDQNNIKKDTQGTAHFITSAHMQNRREYLLH